jgi:hypothetical protein
MRKFVVGTTLVIILAAIAFFWWRFYFVFGEGVKAGELNFVVRKGYVFKTWEGRMIQTGYKAQVPGSVQSNEFDFSIVDEAIAEQLKVSGGKIIEVGYKEYLGALPWRGKSKFIVDTILAIKERPGPASPY